MEAAIITFPKCAERVFVGIARFGGGRWRFQSRTSFVLWDQRNVAVGAVSEAWSIFGAALRTKQRSAQKRSPARATALPPSPQTAATPRHRLRRRHFPT